jgi:hypothetical protein
MSGVFLSASKKLQKSDCWFRRVCLSVRLPDDMEQLGFS